MLCISGGRPAGDGWTETNETWPYRTTLEKRRDQVRSGSDRHPVHRQHSECSLSVQRSTSSTAPMCAAALKPPAASFPGFTLAWLSLRSSAHHIGIPIFKQPTTFEFGAQRSVTDFVRNFFHQCFENHYMHFFPYRLIPNTKCRPQRD